jgi:hypothetical protein
VEDKVCIKMFSNALPLEGVHVKFLVIIRFIFNLLDNNSIGRITERNKITEYTTFILGNPHGGENPAKTSLI